MEKRERLSTVGLHRLTLPKTIVAHFSVGFARDRKVKGGRMATSWTGPSGSNFLCLNAPHIKSLFKKSKQTIGLREGGASSSISDLCVTG